MDARTQESPEAHDTKVVQRIHSGRGGWLDEPNQGQPRQADEGAAHLLRTSGGCNPKFVTIFLVPKAGTNKARMIADCRDINEGMEKGPPLPFASLDELFYILSYLGRRVPT